MKPHALITGAGSGFGAELTRQYAAAGWNVSATMRDIAKAPRDFRDLGSVQLVVLDVAADISVEQGVRAAVGTFGPVDLVANVAAYAQVGTLEETTLEQIRQAFATNVIGALAVTKAVLPSMRERRQGV